MKAEIKVPETLNELTLEQYQLFLERSEDLEGNELAQCIVEVFCAIPKVVVLKISLVDIKAISDHINALFLEQQELQLSFTLSGDGVSQEFGFINDLENITLGEYTDLDSYVTDWTNMHRAMAVLYRPVINRSSEKYTISDYEGSGDYADVMRFMPLDVALGSLVFFYHLGNELLKATLNYLAEETAEMVTVDKSSSVRSGDGTIASMHSLKETLLNLTQSQGYPSPKHSLF